MSDQASLVNEFKSVTGVDDERARFYLQSANWELHTALGTFFDNDGAMDEDIVDVVEQPGPPSSGTNATADQSGSPAASATPRFANISQFQQRAESSDSEEEGQAFYAGGSEHSGQQILGPGKKKNPTQALFDAAKKHGAEAVDDPEGHGKRRGKAPAFQGAGFKLGSDVEPSQQIGVPMSSAPKPQDQNVAIIFWKNGFTVGRDGPLRDFDDPANKEFLGSVGKGEVPAELRARAQGGEVHVTMEDKREEEYVKPKQKMQAFSGVGNMLGSPTPNVTGGSSSTSADIGPSASATRVPSQPVFKIDESQPVTTLQIRLADGTRLVSKFNHTNTVEDIRNVVRNARPNTGDNFNLMTTFPNKVLSDSSQSIKSAGLLNAVIVQRMT